MCFDFSVLGKVQEHEQSILHSSGIFALGDIAHYNHTISTKGFHLKMFLFPKVIDRKSNFSGRLLFQQVLFLIGPEPLLIRWVIRLL